MINKVLKGLFIGVALILPGLSAGTVIIILGFYRRFLEDLSTLHIKPYLPMLIGAAGGVFAGVLFINYLLDHFYTAIMAFILGMLLASIPLVLNCKKIYKPISLSFLKIFIWPLFLGAFGFYLTWFIICEPARTFTVIPPGGHLHFFIGGTLASATMILPGVSGSSILIIMNLYDDVIRAISTLQLIKLGFLVAGFSLGLLGFARLLSALYRRYQKAISFLLAGLILGSSRALLPVSLNLTFFVFFTAGALAVLYLTYKGNKIDLDRE